jgi:prophage antirepressor-like protein
MIVRRESYINREVNQASASIVGIPAVASFQFQNSPVRIATVEGVEVFIAKDLAAVLGFRNARQAVRTHVSKKDRYGVQILDTMGRGQTLLGVNESGMYSMVLGSKKPKALDFKHWVTSEVLPSIRRTGRYERKAGLPALLGQVVDALRGRGAAKERQLNKVVAHRDGSVSFRVGRHWVRHVRPLDASALQLPLAHSLREGLALSALDYVNKERKALIQ